MRTSPYRSAVWNRWRRSLAANLADQSRWKYQQKRKKNTHTQHVMIFSFLHHSSSSFGRSRTWHAFFESTCCFYPIASFGVVEGSLSSSFSSNYIHTRESVVQQKKIVMPDTSSNDTRWPLQHYRQGTAIPSRASLNITTFHGFALPSNVTFGQHRRLFFL